jgi:hypothetical protein
MENLLRKLRDLDKKLDHDYGIILNELSEIILDAEEIQRQSS